MKMWDVTLVQSKVVHVEAETPEQAKKLAADYCDPDVDEVWEITDVQPSTAEFITLDELLNDK